MLDDGDVDVYVGKSPAPFRDKMPAETPEAFYAYWRPSLVARHAGGDSLFVAVIEPFTGAPALASVERLPLPARSLDQVALQVKFQDGRQDVAGCDRVPHTQVYTSPAAEEETPTGPVTSPVG